jgi:hypothetical protein
LRLVAELVLGGLRHKSIMRVDWRRLKPELQLQFNHAVLAA